MVMAPIDFRRPIPRCPLPLPVDPSRFDSFEFAMKDKNKDGGVSLDEWVKSKPGEVTMADVERFKRFDKNGDGKVSLDEYRTGRAVERRWDGWIKGHVEAMKEFPAKAIESVKGFVGTAQPATK